MFSRFKLVVFLVLADTAFLGVLLLTPFETLVRAGQLKGGYHSTELGGTRKFTEQQFQLSSLFDEKVKCCFTLNYDSYIVFGGVSGHLGSLQSHLKAFGLLLW